MLKKYAYIFSYLKRSKKKKIKSYLFKKYKNKNLLVGIGTLSARYCYSVWLRHIVMAKRNNLNTYPGVVAELGPGNSLGVGLAALISGAEKYYALELVKFANNDDNLKVFDELVELFKRRESIPDIKEFPNVKPYLDNYDFPSEIYSKEYLSRVLSPERLKKIRESIVNSPDNNSLIQYKVPWYNEDVIEKSSIDMILSQAVLEHVDDLNHAYKEMKSCLKKDGFLSHQIDFKCHGTSYIWNGHWTYSEKEWNLIRGNDTFLINRFPASFHLKLLQDLNFNILYEKRVISDSKLKASDLNRDFDYLNDSDLTTSGIFIQCVPK